MEENKNRLCEICGRHWFGKGLCEDCNSDIDVRVTMSPQEAQEIGLLD